jgi:hypothetical protein
MEHPADLQSHDFPPRSRSVRSNLIYSAYSMQWRSKCRKTSRRRVLSPKGRQRQFRPNLRRACSVVVRVHSSPLPLRQEMARCAHRRRKPAMRKTPEGFSQAHYLRSHCADRRRLAGSRYRTVEPSGVLGSRAASLANCLSWTPSADVSSPRFAHIAARRPIFVRGRRRDPPGRQVFQLPDLQALVTSPSSPAFWRLPCGYPWQKLSTDFLYASARFNGSKP